MYNCRPFIRRRSVLLLHRVADQFLSKQFHNLVSPFKEYVGLLIQYMRDILKLVELINSGQPRIQHASSDCSLTTSAVEIPPVNSGPSIWRFSAEGKPYSSLSLTLSANLVISSGRLSMDLIAAVSEASGALARGGRVNEWPTSQE